MADKNTRQKRYTEAFRLQAAKLIVEGGYTSHQASSWGTFSTLAKR